MYGKVILIGRLGKDPEVRYTPQGKAVCDLSVAVDKGWGDEKKTTWFKVVTWEKRAEACGQYLAKGKLVYAEGELEMQEWEDREGNKRTTPTVTFAEVKFLSPKSDGDGQQERPAQRSLPQGKPQQRRPQPKADDPNSYGPPPMGADEDVPF